MAKMEEGENKIRKEELVSGRLWLMNQGTLEDFRSLTWQCSSAWISVCFDGIRHKHFGMVSPLEENGRRQEIR